MQLPSRMICRTISPFSRSSWMMTTSSGRVASTKTRNCRDAKPRFRFRLSFSIHQILPISFKSMPVCVFMGATPESIPKNRCVSISGASIAKPGWNILFSTAARLSLSTSLFFAEEGTIAGLLPLPSAGRAPISRHTGSSCVINFCARPKSRWDCFPPGAAMCMPTSMAAIGGSTTSTNAPTPLTSSPISGAARRTMMFSITLKLHSRNTWSSMVLTRRGKPRAGLLQPELTPLTSMPPSRNTLMSITSLTTVSFGCGRVTTTGVALSPDPLEM